MSPKTLETDIHELKSLLMKKDRKAIEFLYDEYASSIFTILFKIVKCEKIASDLLLEFFSCISHNISSFDYTKERLYTWIFKVSRNLAINKNHSSGDKFPLKSKNLIEIAEVGKKINAPSLPKSNILTAEERLIIELIYFYGYTQGEIQSAFKIPIETIKSLALTAVKTLKIQYLQK